MWIQNPPVCICYDHWLDLLMAKISELLLSFKALSPMSFNFVLSIVTIETFLAQGILNSVPPQDTCISLRCITSPVMATLIRRQESQYLSKYPILPPPEGVASNFTNPINHGKPQVVVTSLLLGITVVFVLNRFYMKTFIARKYTLDDRKSCRCVQFFCLLLVH